MYTVDKNGLAFPTTTITVSLEYKRKDEKCGCKLNVFYVKDWRPYIMFYVGHKRCAFVCRNTRYQKNNHCAAKVAQKAMALYGTWFLEPQLLARMYVPCAIDDNHSNSCQGHPMISFLICWAMCLGDEDSGNIERSRFFFTLKVAWYIQTVSYYLFQH